MFQKGTVLTALAAAAVATGAVGAVPTSPVYDDEGNLQTDFFESSVAPTTRGDAGHLKVSRAHPNVTTPPLGRSAAVSHCR